VTEVDEGRHAASSPGTFGDLLDRSLETKAHSVESAAPCHRFSCCFPPAAQTLADVSATWLRKGNFFRHGHESI